MTPAEHYERFVADLLAFCSQDEPIPDSWWDQIEAADLQHEHEWGTA